MSYSVSLAAAFEDEGEGRLDLVTRGGGRASCASDQSQ